MSPLALRVAGTIGLHLGRRQRLPVRMCEMSEPGHCVVKLAAVVRHQPGIHHCPSCAAVIDVDRLGFGEVRILPHRRLPSVTVRAVRAVTR